MNMDVRKRALTLKLLRDGASMEAAALLADAVHPFAELGKWTSERRTEKSVRRIAKDVAREIRVMRSDQQRWVKTQWAFRQYAALAPTGSEAEKAWRDALERVDAKLAAQEATRKEKDERQIAGQIARDFPLGTLIEVVAVGNHETAAQEVKPGDIGRAFLYPGAAVKVRWRSKPGEAVLHPAHGDKIRRLSSDDYPFAHRDRLKVAVVGGAECATKVLSLACSYHQSVELKETFFSSPAEFLGSLHDLYPDLVLIEESLDRAHGLQLPRQARDQSPTLPIYICGPSDNLAYAKDHSTLGYESIPVDHFSFAAHIHALWRDKIGQT